MYVATSRKPDADGRDACRNWHVGIGARRVKTGVKAESRESLGRDLDYWTLDVHYSRWALANGLGGERDRISSIAASDEAHDSVAETMQRGLVDGTEIEQARRTRGDGIHGYPAVDHADVQSRLRSPRQGNGIQFRDQPGESLDRVGPSEVTPGVTTRSFRDNAKSATADRNVRDSTEIVTFQRHHCSDFRSRGHYLTNTPQIA
jgi:hypothetical protein